MEGVQEGWGIIDDDSVLRSVESKMIEVSESKKKLKNDGIVKLFLFAY